VPSRHFVVYQFQSLSPGLWSIHGWSCWVNLCLIVLKPRFVLKFRSLLSWVNLGSFGKTILKEHYIHKTVGFAPHNHYLQIQSLVYLLESWFSAQSIMLLVVFLHIIKRHSISWPLCGHE
jgi:hypothetical protein